MRFGQPLDPGESGGRSVDVDAAVVEVPAFTHGHRVGVGCGVEPFVQPGGGLGDGGAGEVQLACQGCHAPIATGQFGGEFGTGHHIGSTAPPSGVGDVDQLELQRPTALGVLGQVETQPGAHHRFAIGTAPELIEQQGDLADSGVDIALRHEPVLR